MSKHLVSSTIDTRCVSVTHTHTHTHRLCVIHTFGCDTMLDIVISGIESTRFYALVLMRLPKLPNNNDVLLDTSASASRQSLGSVSILQQE
jgi:hypothetical protein